MTLHEGLISEHYTVINLKVEIDIKRRLEALGLIVGTKIQIMNRNLDGSIIFKVRGTRLAIGEKIAKSIYIGEEQSGK